MFRPHWTCYVRERTYSLVGEGDYKEVLRKHNLDERTEWGFWHKEGFMPFKCCWPEAREAMWNVVWTKTYKRGEVPTEQQFDMADEQLDKDMGTPDKLIVWVMTAAELYGNRESLLKSDCLYKYHTLWDAASGVLKTPIPPLILDKRCRIKGENSSTEQIELKDLDTGETIWCDESTLLKQDSGFDKDAIGRVITVKIPRPRFSEWAHEFASKEKRIPLWAR